VIKAVAGRFQAKEAQILKGEYDQEIFKDIEQFPVLDKIIKVERQEIYRALPILEIEAAGYKVLGGLLDLFVSAVTDAGRNKPPSSRSKKLIELLPNQFLGEKRQVDRDPYVRLLKITDYVSGMTDSYAVSTFKKLQGISLPLS
jgi:dGTPase